MKYTIWDIVIIEDVCTFWIHQDRTNKKKWIVLWYSTLKNITVYKVWVIESNYPLALFGWYLYNETTDINVSSKVFTKMFKRTSPWTTCYPLGEDITLLKKYLNMTSWYISTYEWIITSKVWERDNVKYNKVLKSLEKSKTTT
jgi:hypothetical protein